MAGATGCTASPSCAGVHTRSGARASVNQSRAIPGRVTTTRLRIRPERTAPRMTAINRTASPEDLKPTLSMGVTWNHVSSVLAPLIGGFAWYFFGYQVIFVLGAILAVISLGVAQFIKDDANKGVVSQPDQTAP